jgi:hypothetical protein
VRPLTAHGQALAVTQAAEAAEVHEALDVHRDLATKVTLDLDLLLLDDLAQAPRLVVVQLVGPLRERYLRRVEDLLRERFADAVDVGERNVHPLVARKIDACKTCHLVTPASACVVGFHK